MQAIILAAGRGSRMGEFTKDIPKPLIQIGGKTIMEHILDALHACGIFDVIVVVGYKGSIIEDTIGSRYKNCMLTYIFNKDFKKSDNLYSLWLAHKYVTSNGMIFLNGDTIFHESILRHLIEDSCKDGLIASVSAGEEKNPIVIHEDRGRIVEIGHSISLEVNGVASGLYKLSQETSASYFKEAEKVFANGPQKGGFVITIQRLASSIHFQAIRSEDRRWININTPSDRERACGIIAEIIT